MDDRLGSGPDGVDEIKQHPFFADVDWENLRTTAAPNLPQLSGEVDTRYFDQFEETEPFYPAQKPSADKLRR
jgi:hypothetical protein